MTDSMKKRIIQALEETNRYIDKESARADDLRPAEAQKCLDDYIAHRAKLVKMLEAA